jgi:5'-nucleotidase
VLGTLDVALDKDGKVTSCTGKPTLLVAGDIAGNIQQQNATTKKYEDVTGTTRTAFLGQLTGTAEQIADDPDALTALAPYKQAIETLKTQVIATVTEDLWHVRIPGMTHTISGEVLTNGSYIAPYVIESYLWKASALAAKAEIGVINAGGVRIDIPKGNLTMGQVYELQPFGNTLFVLKVTGKELKDALDGAVTLATQATSPSTGAFPYPAGFRYTADITKPVGSRLTTLEINKAGTWTAMSDTTTYTLVTLSFVAGGGDGYTAFKNATTYRYETGIVDAETFADWAQNVKKTFARPTSTGITYIK